MDRMASIVSAGVRIITARRSSGDASPIFTDFIAITLVFIDAGESILDGHPAGVCFQVADFLCAWIPIVRTDRWLPLNTSSSSADLDAIAEHTVRAGGSIGLREVASATGRIADGLQTGLLLPRTIHRDPATSASTAGVIGRTEIRVVAGFGVRGVRAIPGLRVTEVVRAEVFVSALGSAANTKTVCTFAGEKAGPDPAGTLDAVIQDGVHATRSIGVTGVRGAGIAVVTRHGLTHTVHPGTIPYAGISSGTRIGVVASDTRCLPVPVTGVRVVLFRRLVAPGIPTGKVGRTDHRVATEAGPVSITGVVHRTAIAVLAWRPFRLVHEDSAGSRLGIAADPLAVIAVGIIAGLGLTAATDPLLTGLPAGTEIPVLTGGPIIHRVVATPMFWIAAVRGTGIAVRALDDLPGAAAVALADVSGGTGVSVVAEAPGLGDVLALPCSVQDIQRAGILIIARSEPCVAAPVQLYIRGGPSPSFRRVPTATCGQK